MSDGCCTQLDGSGAVDVVFQHLSQELAPYRAT